mmetsp:Transcript_1684/g.2037  ORF Transcript_1684/g.2037 Transcript_1684/m.2037 type:complete len:149 (-) Transcript_1684:37-483(-)
MVKLKEALLKRYGPFLRSERYLFLAFTVYEGLLVNLPAAAAFLLAPSFTARELAPRYKEDPLFDHPGVKVLIQLFGATEILVAGLFINVLNKNNAAIFLKTVLAGDLVHFLAYFYYTFKNLKISPGMIAHFATMTSVIVTKLLYFIAN